MIRALFLFPKSAVSQELDKLLSEGFNSERKNALGMRGLGVLIMAYEVNEL
jgi:hypothetical protein